MPKVITLAAVPLAFTASIVLASLPFAMTISVVFLQNFEKLSFRFSIVLK